MGDLPATNFFLLCIERMVEKGSRSKKMVWVWVENVCKENVQLRKMQRTSPKKILGYEIVFLAT